MQAHTERTSVTQDSVEMELALIAFSNIRDYISWTKSEVTTVMSGTLTDDQRRAVAEATEIVNVEGGRTVKAKLHDKLSALDKLARHLNLYEGEGSGDKSDKKSLTDLVREANEGRIIDAE